MPIADDYRQILEGAALAEPMARGLVAVSGKDRRGYLQGLLTNNIEALVPGGGCYAAWLTAQGRMTTDLHVLESGDMILLDVPEAQTASVLQRLDQLIFSEDVALADLSPQLATVGLHGPGAAAALARALGLGDDLAAWPQYRNVRAALDETPVVVARIDMLGVPGFTLYVGRDAAPALRRALEAQGARGVGMEAVTAARIEAGYPLFGGDMTDDIIPLEAGIESRAIALDKGCYVGQEVIIRVLHRGHGRVARKLVGLVLEGEALVAPGSAIRAGGRDAGFVTSAAVSPVFGSIALGYLHRDFLEPGPEVEVQVVDVDGAAPAAADASGSGSAGRVWRGAVRVLPFRVAV